jgi:opacity protein-like surface antigen
MHITMKKIFFILITLLFLNNGFLNAQGYGLQLGSMNPLGKTAYILKPGYGGEFHFLPGDIDERWKLNLALGYHIFKPTQDTFNTYGLEISQQTTLYPGYSIMRKYSIASIGAGFIFKILDKDFSPFIGADANVSIITLSQTNVSAIISSSSDNDSYWRFAIGPKAGICYQVTDNWLLNAGVGSSFGFGNSGVQSYWRPFLSINYFID